MLAVGAHPLYRKPSGICPSPAEKLPPPLLNEQDKSNTLGVPNHTGSFQQLHRYNRPRSKGLRLDIGVPT